MIIIFIHNVNNSHPHPACPCPFLSSLLSLLKDSSWPAATSIKRKGDAICNSVEPSLFAEDQCSWILLLSLTREWTFLRACYITRLATHDLDVTWDRKIWLSRNKVPQELKRFVGIHLYTIHLYMTYMSLHGLSFCLLDSWYK